MAEPVNATFLALAEAFGTRNQEQFLGEVIQPVRDVLGDMLLNLRLVGADSPTSAVIAAGGSQSTSVRIEQDTYVTGMWIQEPSCTVIDTCPCTAAFVLRNQSGTFSQLVPLRIDPRQLIGGGNSYQRIYPLDGVPFGTLLRAGDLISVTLFNVGAAVTNTGFTIGYRGLSGPPG